MFEGNVFVGMEGESGVAFGGFPFGARQCVFFAAVGMEEDGKIFADGQETLRQHGFGIRADDDPVAVADGQAQ